ncbi:ProQ/FINO family protein [Curvibacter microcysteis]|uniref:ProQ/FINO family protein n=1 Tax=Curvibacter microcysteis TaxID=3026419 RepID=UPI0023624157|nr:ProQ/FINO family protein [Curvibacter sp. RS43]
MTDSVSEKEQSQAANTPVVSGASDAAAVSPVAAAAPEATAVTAGSPAEASEAPAVAERSPRNSRGRRSGAGRGAARTEGRADGRDAARDAGRAPAGRADGRRAPRRDPAAQGAGTGAAAQAGAKAAAPRAPRSHPVLEQLAGLYPALFGEVFLPLKRGIFQDLQDAHPELFEREALKAALALHTRSSRYLTAVASGLARHDLQGQSVEAMAPEHIYHALTEVFRRRQQRAGEDLRPKLRRRIIQAFESSGLSREAYAALVLSRDEAANALLDEALAEAASQAARDEAQLRAFEASGQSLDAFADMYGLDARDAARTLDRARQRRAAPATPVAADPA